MRILALGSHPDDIEFGCGGTLIKYTRRGHDLFLMVLTGGDGGGDPVLRRREQVGAAAILGAKEVFWGEYRDTEIPVNKGLIQKIEDVVKSVAPDFIFVHHREDTHQDHRHLAACTISATRYTRNVLFYEGPTTHDFTPSVFVDIEAVLEEKVRALQTHTSQVLKTNIEGLSIVDLCRTSAHFRGIQGRVRCAEGFVPLRLFINVGINRD